MNYCALVLRQAAKQPLNPCLVVLWRLLHEALIKLTHGHQHIRTWFELVCSEHCVLSLPALCAAGCRRSAVSCGLTAAAGGPAAGRYSWEYLYLHTDLQPFRVTQSRSESRPGWHVGLATPAWVQRFPFARTSKLANNSAKHPPASPCLCPSARAPPYLVLAYSTLGAV